MAFPCKRCSYSATTKASLIRHLMSKTPCEVKNDNIPCETLIEQLQHREYKTDTIVCPGCNKLQSKSHLSRHKKVCKQVKQANNHAQETTQVSLEDLENVQAQVIELKDKLQTLCQVLEKHEQDIQDLQQSRGEVVASTSQTVKTSTVIKTSKSKISQALRIVCWNTYIGEEIGKAQCVCCMTNFITQHNFHCGHVVAEAKGGKVQVSNLRPICAVCNNSMGTMNMMEFALNNFDVEI
jgi:hypothetical protein